MMSSSPDSPTRARIGLPQIDTNGDAVSCFPQRLTGFHQLFFIVAGRTQVRPLSLISPDRGTGSVGRK